MQNSAQINLKQSLKMLNLLSTENDLTFQTFCERPTCKSNGRTFNGSFKQHVKSLATLNENGAGIFVCVNQTNGNSRKAKDITKVRALFADFDTPNLNRLNELLKLNTPPSLIIESSPNKHHAYWILKSDSLIALEEFKPLQQKLAAHFKADPSVCDLPRVLRVAGFLHHKDTPFTSKICHIGDKYSASQLRDWVLTLSGDKEQVIQSTENFDLGEPPEHIKDAMRFIDLKEWNLSNFHDVIDINELHLALKHIPNDHRDVWLKVGMALKNSGLPTAYECWSDWSKSSQKYNESDQLRTWNSFETTPGGITIATIFHLAKENGYIKTSIEKNTALENANGVPIETKINYEAEIKYLATLSDVDYEACRSSAAERLGFRATMLDNFVKQSKLEHQEKNDAMVEDIEPWNQKVDGATLLNEIFELIKEYIVAEDSTVIAATLWIAFTWCIDVMEISPIACITAPEKRCGKTQFLNVISELVKRPLPASNITAAALFRSIAKWTPTLLIDEADSFMKDNEDLRGILNAGHSRRNAYVIRTVGDNHEPKKFNVWGAKAISGIGHLPDTLRDRSIILELRRKEKHEARKKLRHANAEDFNSIKQKLCRWANDNMQKLKEIKPTMPNFLNDRAQDNWEPLFMIAECIGKDWLDLAISSASTVSEIEEESLSINELLLTDIKIVFETTQKDLLFTEELINSLCQNTESRWKSWNHGTPITPRQLSTRLRSFHIKSKDIHKDGEHRKGYKKNDFKDVFNRYLTS